MPLGWTTTLSLGAELAQVWEEAFPKERCLNQAGAENPARDHGLT
jgi:hypothetical protein